MLYRVRCELVQDDPQPRGLRGRDDRVRQVQLERDAIGGRGADQLRDPFDIGTHGDLPAGFGLMQRLVQGRDRLEPPLNDVQRLARFGLLGPARLHPGQRRNRLERILDAVIDLAPQHVRLAQGAAQVELGHHLACQHLERLPLQRRQLAGLVVQHAQRPDRQTLGRDQRRAGIEPQVRVAQHQRVVRRARVGVGVADLEIAVGQDRMAADRFLDPRLPGAHPGFRLEELSVGVHQADHGHRHAADRRRQLDDVVEHLFALGVQNVVFRERGKPFGLAGMRVSFHRAGPNGSLRRSDNTVPEVRRKLAPVSSSAPPPSAHRSLPHDVRQPCHACDQVI